MKIIPNNKVVKPLKGVPMKVKRTVVKKKVVKRPQEIVPLCNALVASIDRKLKGSPSWAFSASLIGARIAVNELIQALYTR